MNREIKFRFWTGSMMEQWDHVRSWTDIEYYFKGGDNYIPLQYTGFKGKNGTDIYEGDIVKYAGWICFIKYGENGACFSIITKKGETDLSIITKASCNYIEVIGNIYENPELMEESKNG